MKCYRLILDYIEDDNVESEDCFCQMVAEVRKQKIAIPSDLYRQIEEFIDTNIAPFVYEYSGPEYTEDEARYENGTLHLLTEEATHKAMAHFLDTLCEMTDKTEEFGLKVLQPYLLS